MPNNQLSQIQRLKKVWHLRACNIFKTSGYTQDTFLTLLMAIITESNSIVEYGCHTGQLSSLFGALTDSVNGKFTGIDNWLYFRSTDEKSKSIIKANLDFVGVKNYEIITANCEVPLYINADFHFWDICIGDEEKLVASIHAMIDHAKDRPMTFCIDDSVRTHHFGNKEFVECWKKHYNKISGLELLLVTENKIFLTNKQIDKQKLKDTIDLMKAEGIISYESMDRFYNQPKYLGALVDGGPWITKSVLDPNFWDAFEEIFK